MKFPIKDIILVGLISTIIFPVILVLVLMLTGVVHLSVGVEDNAAKDMTKYLEKYSPIQDQADAQQSKLFEANKLKINELAAQQKEVQTEVERLENLKAENSQIKDEITKQKEEIEKLVGQNKELTDKRLESLAQVYGNMKPVEAAPILLTMDDPSIAKIMKKMTEPRTKAKLLAALGAMDKARAAEISRLLGWKNTQDSKDSKADSTAQK